jgi:glycosyltransferase involved in cell wall biosynthesis
MINSLVDIAVITFQQEKYLRTCLERILYQKTTFGFRITVYDDHSLDATQEICNDLIEKNGEVLRYHCHSRNLGITANWKHAIESSTAKYLVICEGDDYWLDPYKLQKQIDLMEAHPECTLCVHDYQPVSRDAAVIPATKYPMRYRTTWHDVNFLANGNYFLVLTAVFRRSALIELPAWMTELPTCDYILFMLAAKQGHIAWIKQPMAVYRNSGGVWSSLGKRESYLKWVKMMPYVVRLFPGPAFKEVRARLVWIMFRHHQLLAQEGDYSIWPVIEENSGLVLEVFGDIMQEYHELKLAAGRRAPARKLAADLLSLVREKLPLGNH